jgi:hypothetical protein
MRRKSPPCRRRRAERVWEKRVVPEMTPCSSGSQGAFFGVFPSTRLVWMRQNPRILALLMNSTAPVTTRFAQKSVLCESPLTLLAAPQPPRLSGGCWPAACGRWLSGEPPLSGAATVFDAPRSAAPCDPAGSLISSSQLRQVSHRRSLLPLRSRSRRRTHHGPRRQHLLWLRAHATAEGRGPPLHVRHSCRLHWPWQAVLQQRPGGARW